MDVTAADLAAALVPMNDTSLGPLAGGLTLRQIGLPDRLRELDFEIPLAGGDVRGAAPNVSVSDVGELLRAYLPDDDPFAPYVDRLTSAALGNQSLRGYLSGSIDAVLRLPDQRYLVVDYKTNYLGDNAADYGPARMAEAMLHSDYPLQALLYTVVLHRFLRWRVPSYDPAAAPRRGAVSVRAGHVRCRYPGDRRAAVRRVQLAAARRRWWSRSRIYSTREGRRRDCHRRGACGRRERLVADVQRGWRAGCFGRSRSGSDLRSSAKSLTNAWRLAVALLVRGLRGGSVCIELETIASDIGVDDVPWPDVCGLARRRCGTVRCLARFYISTTSDCSISTGIGARRSRSATTCWRCRCPSRQAMCPPRSDFSRPVSKSSAKQRKLLWRKRSQY